MLDRVVEAVNKNADELTDVANVLYSDVGYKFTLWGTKTVSNLGGMAYNFTSVDFTKVDVSHPELLGCKALLITEDFSIRDTDQYLGYCNHTLTVSLLDVDDGLIASFYTNNDYSRFSLLARGENGVMVYSLQTVRVETKGVVAPVISVSSSYEQIGSFNKDILDSPSINDFNIKATNYNMNNTSYMPSPEHTFYVYAAF
jgi:hypothetical protein